MVHPFLAWLQVAISSGQEVTAQPLRPASGLYRRHGLVPEASCASGWS